LHGAARIGSIRAMEQTQALEIIRSLAKGVDPTTGEVFPADSAFQQPDVIRALHLATEALQRAAKAERKNQQLPAGTGKPWNAEEDQALVTAFESGSSIKDLAAAHERTNGAIRSRLMKLGKLEVR
jgi:uncharacterized protein with gpF-like domain